MIELKKESHKKIYNQVLYNLENIEDKIDSVDIYNYSLDDFEPILLYELLDNIRLIIENERQNNLSSMGVDICCRVIIEECALLRAHKNDWITDAQRALFLLEYLSADIDAHIKKADKTELKELFENKKQKLLEEYQRILNCDINKAKEVATARRAYLQYGGKRYYPSMNVFVLASLGKDYLLYREKLNIFIHPSYTEGEHFAYDKDIENERKRIINTVLSLGLQFVPELDDKVYRKTKWNNEYLDEWTLSTIKSLRKQFKETFKYDQHDESYDESNLKNNATRWIIFSCFRKLEDVFVDMLICDSLNMKTQIASRCKAFLEMVSMLGSFVEVSDLDRTTEDFVMSTITALSMKENYRIFDKIQKHKKLSEAEELKYDELLTTLDRYYVDFKKNHDYPSCEEEFAIGMRSSMLYFINPDVSYSHKNLTIDMINKFIGDVSTRKRLISDYHWSSKLGHVCAYKNTYKENKLYNLLPDLIHYFNEILDRIYDVEGSEALVDYLDALKKEIISLNKEAYNNEQSKIYKAA